LAKRRRLSIGDTLDVKITSEMLVNKELIKIDDAVNAVKVFALFKDQCELMIRKRRNKRIFCTVPPSFSMFINQLFCIFIFSQKEAEKRWTEYAVLVEEHLNERIEI
jgi:hypothetical protein